MKAFWLLLLCWLTASAAAADERRVALVVGIGAYQRHDVLRNAVPDASLIAEALDKTGFAVTTGHDLDRAGFEHALAAFESRIGPADTALIYFSGHAVQADDRNVLLATDSQGASGVPFYKLLNATSRARLRIIMIDACRNSPLGDGVTADLKPEHPTGETVIIFSAEAGTEASDGAGDHSPFASSLARHIGDGLELVTMMRFVADDVRAATGNRQNPEVRVGAATAFYFGASFAFEPGLNEAARQIARELEGQFEQAGFSSDLQRPTVVYEVEAQPVALGPSLDPDHVDVKVTKRWTDPTFKVPALTLEARYPWRNPRSSARNAAEQLFRQLQPTVRGESDR